MDNNIWCTKCGQYLGKGDVEVPVYCDSCYLSNEKRPITQ